MGARKNPQCVICRKTIPSKRAGKDTCCRECGIEKALRAAEQIRNKRGKYYQKWIEGSTRYYNLKNAEKWREKRNK